MGCSSHSILPLTIFIYLIYFSMKRLLRIEGRKAVRKYYTKLIWQKKVNDYPSYYYVSLSFIGAIIGIMLMGFVLYES